MTKIIYKSKNIRIVRISEASYTHISYGIYAVKINFVNYNWYSNIEFKLFGKKKIQIKIYQKNKPDDPVILSTGLKWSTFNGSDNILVLWKLTDNQLYLHVCRKDYF